MAKGKSIKEQAIIYKVYT